MSGGQRFADTKTALIYLNT